jgi:hypothetical protein
MPHPKRPNQAGNGNSFPPGSILGLLAERTQLDFELDFYGKLLAAVPDFTEALRVQACNLTIKGRLQDGLVVDEKLVAVRPDDPTAHYNLACRYALLKQRDKAITALRRAVELGYRDFAFMAEDHDLDSIRKDPRFRKLIKEFQALPVVSCQLSVNSAQGAGITTSLRTDY